MVTVYLLPETFRAPQHTLQLTQHHRCYLATYNHIRKKTSQPTLLRAEPHHHQSSAAGPCGELKVSHALSHTHLWVLTPEWILPPGLFSQQPAAFKETARPLTAGGAHLTNRCCSDFHPGQLAPTPQRKSKDPAPLAPVSSPPPAPCPPAPGQPQAGLHTNQLLQ